MTMAQLFDKRNKGNKINNETKKTMKYKAKYFRKVNATVAHFVPHTVAYNHFNYTCNIIPSDNNEISESNIYAIYKNTLAFNKLEKNPKTNPNPHAF